MWIERINQPLHSSPLMSAPQFGQYLNSLLESGSICCPHLLSASAAPALDWNEAFRLFFGADDPAARPGWLGFNPPDLVDFLLECHPLVMHGLS